MNASTYKKNHNYKAEYLHELEVNDKKSDLLQMLDRENERLSDKLEQALKEAEGMKAKVNELLPLLNRYISEEETEKALKIMRELKELSSK